MISLTPEELDAIEARALAVPEGPYHDDGYRIYGPTDHADKRNGEVLLDYKHTLSDRAPNLPDLIVHAREDLLRLVAQVRRHERPQDLGPRRGRRTGGGSR